MSPALSATESRTASNVMAEATDRSIRAAIQKVVDGDILTTDEAAAAMQEIMTGAATPAQIASLITALRIRGETVDEIAGFARTMREHALPVRIDTDRPVVDTVGTGGDNMGTFNISTTAAFVIAGAGVAVAKHGNRSVTSKCGSADLLEGLGVRIDLTPEQVTTSISEAGIGFMFAPLFHPGFRHAGPPRREIGVRTVFNILGPLTNPARVRRQVLGAADSTIAPKLAAAQSALGADRVVVVHSAEGLDELSIAGPSTITQYDAGRETIETYVIEPGEFGLTPANLSEMLGGDLSTNVEITKRVLAGERGAKRDVVVLNAAAGLLAAGVVESIGEGVPLAQESIDSGRARAALDSMIAVTQRFA
jgi:anthranilate phosphoribosyltransferase